MRVGLCEMVWTHSTADCSRRSAVTRVDSSSAVQQLHSSTRRVHAPDLYHSICLPGRLVLPATRRRRQSSAGLRKPRRPWRPLSRDQLDRQVRPPGRRSVSNLRVGDQWLSTGQCRPVHVLRTWRRPGQCAPGSLAVHRRYDLIIPLMIIRWIGLQGRCNRLPELKTTAAIQRSNISKIASYCMPLSSHSAKHASAYSCRAA